MRVLLVHEFYRSSAPSGEDAVYRNERDMLSRGGVDVVPYEVFNDEIDDSSVMKRLLLGLNTVWSPRSYKSLSYLLKSFQPDITHFHNTFPVISPSAYAACQDHRVPVVQTLHNYRFICACALLQRVGRPCEDCIGGNLLPALIHRCYRGRLSATIPLVSMMWWNRYQGTYRQKIDRYIALTNFAASRFKAGGLPEDRFSIKPNFLPDPPRIGRGEGGYAVFVGRLSKEKGIITLLHAWNDVRTIPLKILGDGPLREELQHYANRQSLPIDFLGAISRERVLDIIRNAALQIIPSEWYEGFPMVLLEAYACGTPVVASRIGSLNELVISGITGSKFIPGDAKSLAETTKQLWSNKKQLQVLRLNARSLFDKEYTEHRNLDILMNIYRTISEHHQSSK